MVCDTETLSHGFKKYIILHCSQNKGREKLVLLHYQEHTLPLTSPHKTRTRSSSTL